MATSKAAGLGSDKFDLTFPQGLGGLQSLDLSLNGLSSVPLGLLDELQNLRYMSMNIRVFLYFLSEEKHWVSVF